MTYVRDSLLSVTLGWSPSAVISATPQYHVFVNNSNGIIMNDNTTNTELSLSLRPDDEYNIRLVATGQDLPSEIITVTVPQGIITFNCYFNNFHFQLSVLMSKGQL